MKSAQFLLALVLLVAIGCEESIDSPDNPRWLDENFIVNVVNPADLNACGLPIITFTEKLDRIRELTGSEVSTFNAYQLKEEFQVDGLKLKIKIRKTRNDELLPCKAMGIARPWVTVLDSRIAN